MHAPRTNVRNAVLRAAALAAAFLAFPQTVWARAPELVVPPGGAGCPAAGELRREISTHLGRDVFDAPDAPRVTVRVVGGAAAGLGAEIEIVQGRVLTRHVIEGTGETCADLVRAAALSAALAIEQDPAKAAPEPAPSESAPAAPRLEGQASVAPAGEPRERVVAVGSALTSVGLLPRPGLGVGAGVRARVSEVTWLSARGLWLPDADMPDRTFAMRLLAGGAGACVEPRLGSAAVKAVGCAHIVVGALDVTRTTVAMASSGGSVFSAASLSAGARARVAGPLTIEGGVEGVLPFSHPTFLTAICPASGFQQPFAALVVALGAGVSIP